MIGKQHLPYYESDIGDWPRKIYKGRWDGIGLGVGAAIGGIPGSIIELRQGHWKTPQGQD